MAQRPQSVGVFRHALRGLPDVVAGQVDVLPAERREVGEQLVGDVLQLTKSGDSTLQVARAPQDDGGDEQIEAGGAVLLVLVRAVADLTKPVNKNRARQAVAGFALFRLSKALAENLGKVRTRDLGKL
jgi:hypothetical protein